MKLRNNLRHRRLLVIIIVIALMLENVIAVDTAFGLAPWSGLQQVEAKKRLKVRPAVSGKEEVFTQDVIESRKHLVRGDKYYQNRMFEAAQKEYEVACSLAMAVEAITTEKKALLEETWRDAQTGIEKAKKDVHTSVMFASEIDEFETTLLNLLQQKIAIARKYWLQELGRDPVFSDLRSLHKELKNYCEGFARMKTKGKRQAEVELFKENIDRALKRAARIIDEFIDEYQDALFSMGYVRVVPPARAHEILSVPPATEEVAPEEEVSPPEKPVALPFSGMSDEEFALKMEYYMRLNLPLGELLDFVIDNRDWHTAAKFIERIEASGFLESVGETVVEKFKRNRQILIEEGRKCITRWSAFIRDKMRQYRPGIVMRYDHLSMLTTEEIQTLEEDVYAITMAHFNIWGLRYVLSRRILPQFRGSYKIALQHTFPELHLEPLGFQLKWANEEDAIRSLRFVLGRKAPRLMARYEKFDDLTTGERNALRRDVYRITSNDLILWGLQCALQRQTAPYFEGSYRNTLRAVFPKLNLDPLGFWLDWSSREQGIASVRFVLSEKVPHLLDSYDKFDTLNEKQREELRKSIYDISSTDLQVWGLRGALNRKEAPYFNGSYVDVLCAIFPKLALNPLGFSLDWSTREKAIESICFTLSREASDIMDRYNRFDELDRFQRDALREDIYSIHSDSFRMMGLAVILNKKAVPYFEGNYRKALQAVFPRLDLDTLGFTFDWSRKERALETIRFVLSREVPDIIERYDRLAFLTESEKEVLQNDIYKITAGHFQLWGLHVIFHTKSVDFFDGSYIKALQEVFPKLDLQSYGFQLDWSSQVSAMASIRFIFSKEIPDIMERYDNLAALKERGRADLLDDICSINTFHIKAWGLSSISSKKKVSYFDGDYINLLLAVFHDPALGITRERIVQFRKAHSERIYRWREGKEQGIANIRDAFQRYRPDILRKYDKYDILSGTERELLQKAVYAVNSNHLRAWGLTRMSMRESAPYFEGSYIKALHEVFPKLDLDPLGFKLDWSTEEKAAESIRFVLSREAPAIMERYWKLGELTDERKDVLRRDVYRIQHGHFSAWNLSAACDKRKAPYFKGSYITALNAALPQLNLNPYGFALDWSSEEKALESVQYVLSQKTPDIVDRYNRLDSLEDYQIKALRDDIYKINQIYIRVWGLNSILQKRAVSYFDGNHITCLRKLFPKLQLNSLGFNYDWTTRKKSKETLMFILSNELPDIHARYANIEKLTEEEKNVLRKNIYEITSLHFIDWGISTQSLACFGGSYINALCAVFRKLDLNPLGFKLDWKTRKRSIESIRFVLMDKAPTIVELYKRVDGLEECQRDALRNMVYKLDTNYFRSWGLSGCLHRKVPYFRSSFIRALKAVFPRLELNPLGFRLDWSTKGKALASLRFVLSREIPHIMERYENIDRLGEDEKKRLKDDIYHLNADHFLLWNLGSVSSVPYFKGSYVGALQAVFPRLNLHSLGFGLKWSTRYKAINSVRYVLSQKVPDIVSRYDRFDELDKAQIRLLRDDIYHMKLVNFEMWGLSKIKTSREVPYFGGSFIKALQIVFPLLDLDPLGFQLNWKTKKKAIASVQFVFSRERPDIIQRYDNLQNLAPKDVEILKEDIYAVTFSHFSAWGLSRAGDKREVKWFKGSYIGALQAVFPKLNLNPLGFLLDWSSKEQAIKSVRFVFTRERPDIIERYNKFDTLMERERNNLRKDLYNITQGHINVWGLSRATSKEGTSHFGGGYINMLQKVFPKLDLNPLGFQCDWSTKERGIASLRYVFWQEIPDIMKRYDAIDTLTNDEIKILKKEICRIGYFHFMIWNVTGAFRRGTAPYFKGSYVNALMAVFSDRRLKLTKGDILRSDTKRREHRYSWQGGEEEAIGNMICEIEEHIPDVMTRYRNLAQLTDGERKVLVKDVHGITYTHLRMWGLARILNRDIYPWFNGSYVDALMAVFPKLNLNPLDFKLDWSTRKDALRTIRHVLQREIPDVMEEFRNFETLDESRKSALREKVYSISYGHFQIWGLGNVLDKRKVPFFKGSHIEALKAVFSKLGISRFGFRLDFSTKQKAIASMWFVLWQEVPGIIERYERIDSLTTEEIELLKRDIYRISTTHLHAWGLDTVFKKQIVPYFGGSYITALLAVFPALDLNPLGFRLDLSSKERTIASIRFILSREIPDIVERYDALDTLQPDEAELLRRDIYKISGKHFRAWGLGSIMGTEYFKGSFVSALIATFPKLELNRYGFQLSWDNREDAIASIRFVLSQEIPDVMERYGRLYELDAKQIASLKEEICCITAKQLREWGLSRALYSKDVPYFRGSYVTMLCMVFDDPKLGLKEQDFISESRDDKARDSSTALEKDWYKLFPVIRNLTESK